MTDGWKPVRRRPWLWVLLGLGMVATLAVGALLVLGALVLVADDDGAGPASNDRDTPYQSFGDGVYRVPEEVEPGTYQAANIPNECYWERLSGFDGTMDHLIINGIEENRTVVHIQEGDQGFLSDGCGTWVRID